MSYRTVTWEDVQKNCLPAYTAFEDMVKKWINLYQSLRLCFRLALKDGVPMTVENVMNLFAVRAKHNWKWMSAIAVPELMAPVIAANADISRPFYGGSMLANKRVFKYVWHAHHSWWAETDGSNE
jgi:hypothetical protein